MTPSSYISQLNNQSNTSHTSTIAQQNKIVNTLKPDFVKIFATLNNVSFAHKEQDGLAFNYQLHSLDFNHNGKIPKTEAILLLKKYFKISERTSYRFFKRWNGIFFDDIYNTEYHQSFILIYSYERIKVRYGIKNLNRTTLIPYKHFQKRQEIRAHMLAANFVDKHFYDYHIVSPLSRQSLEEKTHIKKRTQQRYAKIEKVKGHLKVIKNLITSGNGNLDLMPVKTKSKTYYIPKQQGNIYVSKFKKGVRRFKNEKREKTKSNQSCDSQGAKGTKKLKRFFHNYQSFLKSKKFDFNSFIFEHAYKNVVIWSKCYIDIELFAKTVTL